MAASGTLSPKTWMENLDKALEEDNFINRYLDKIEKKTNVKKRYVVLVLCSFLSVYLVIGYAADLLCNMIGFVYPAYISVKAIESTRKDDDTEWLIYWVVFATFSVAEFFSDILLSWFPFYFLGKCVFLLWCMAPVSWNGSRMIYYKFIRPFILRNEGQIDKVLSHMKGGMQELASQAQEGATEIATDAVADAIKNKDE
ncbi:receptor expression-enhancing protein 5-like isoform X2 [Clavelina lepadiformis]|uniref:receptor expression-enhancing protein 5-like isoform X2 n=1 Tax=Clavelina lepadiformis TaxID=159417 RepID=UPI00404292A4